MDEEQHAIVSELQSKLERLERQQQAQGELVELPEALRVVVPAHMQEPPMDKEERRSSLRKLARVQGLPAVLKDNNGMALHGLNDKHVKEVINTTFPLLQNLELDLLRVLVHAFMQSEQGLDPHETLGFAVEICADNLRHLGRAQLQLTLKAHDLQASESLMDPNSRVVGDNSIIQRPHLEASQRLGDFRRMLDQSKRRLSGVPGRGGRFQPYNRGRSVWRGRGGGGGSRQYQFKPRGYAGGGGGGGGRGGQAQRGPAPAHRGSSRADPNG
jgi:hypothetical protein